MTQTAGVQFGSIDAPSSHHQPPPPMASPPPQQVNNNSVASHANTGRFKPNSGLITGPREEYLKIKYLYHESNGLIDDCWNDKNRGWLLEKSVENDMCVKRYQNLGRENGNVLGILAGKTGVFDEVKSNIIVKAIKLSKRIYSMFITHQSSENKHPGPNNGNATKDFSQKHEASHETKCNIISKSITSVFAFIGSKLGAYDKKNRALPLLRIIWKDIANKQREDIDRILTGGLKDLVKQDKSTSRRMVLAIQLQELSYEQIVKLKDETQNILKGKASSTTQYTNITSEDVDHVQLLKKLISKYVVKMHIESQRIVEQANTPVVGKGDLAMELQNLISKHIVNMHEESQDILKRVSGKHDQAQHPQNLIFKNITTLCATTKLKESYSSRVLFIATEMGIAKFLVQLIRQHPYLIWKVNDNGLSIFHITVKHRHEGIYNLSYEIGAMKDLITPLKEEHENNMLHLVGTSAKQKQLEDVSGVALQMQQELLWFQEVEKMIPPSYRERKNKDGLTPHELFTIEHKELATQSEKWMKGTSSQCMVVAALIATIVFAVAFTVPGGYDQKNAKKFETLTTNNQETAGKLEALYFISDANRTFCHVPPETTDETTSMASHSYKGKRKKTSETIDVDALVVAPVIEMMQEVIQKMIVVLKDKDAEVKHAHDMRKIASSKSIHLEKEVKKLKAQLEEVEANHQAHLEKTIEEAKVYAAITILKTNLQMAKIAEAEGANFWVEDMVGWAIHLEELTKVAASEWLENIKSTAGAGSSKSGGGQAEKVVGDGGEASGDKGMDEAMKE